MWIEWEMVPGFDGKAQTMARWSYRGVGEHLVRSEKVRDRFLQEVLKADILFGSSC
jgi:hypothetical protein